MTAANANVVVRPLVIIAGAGPGIGRSVARSFAAEGYRVAPLAWRRSALEAIAGELTDASIWPVDLSDPSAVKSDRAGRQEVLSIKI